MRRSPLFTLEDDGHTPLYILRYEGVREDGKEPGPYSCVTNESFSHLFRSALALVGDTMVHRALQSLLLIA